MVRTIVRAEPQEIMANLDLANQQKDHCVDPQERKLIEAEITLLERELLAAIHS